MENQDFYTFREYLKRIDKPLTASMEDYLEMIYRLSDKNGFTRIHDLSRALNVQPPAATRMVQKLAALELIDYQKYGVVMLKELGKQMGDALLKRHNTLESFLYLLGINENDILEETEKIEHIITQKTLNLFIDFVEFMNSNPEVIEGYRKFREKNNN